MGRPTGPDRNTGRYDDRGEVRREDFERDMRSLDRRLGEPRTVSANGRAGWERGLDTGRTPTHRQVFWTKGGAVGAQRRAAVAFTQDGGVRLRQRADVSTYNDVALTSAELQRLRQLLDHVTAVLDPQAD